MVPLILNVSTSWSTDKLVYRVHTGTPTLISLMSNVDDPCRVTCATLYSMCFVVHRCSVALERSIPSKPRRASLNWILHRYRIIIDACVTNIRWQDSEVVAPRGFQYWPLYIFRSVIATVGRWPLWPSSKYFSLTCWCSRPSDCTLWLRWILHNTYTHEEDTASVAALAAIRASLRQWTTMIGARCSYIFPCYSKMSRKTWEFLLLRKRAVHLPLGTSKCNELHDPEVSENPTRLSMTIPLMPLLSCSFKLVFLSSLLWHDV